MKSKSHGAWFLGPKAECQEVWEKFIVYILRDHIHWRKNYYPSDNVVVSRSAIRENEQWIDSLSDELDKILSDFKVNNPVFSPRYLAHMISEQSLPSVLGYFAGMLYNANNIDSESSPVAVPMELEACRMISSMLGYDAERSYSHITSGGTIANIEALWVARTIKFVPFMMREFCEKRQFAFKIHTPNGDYVELVGVDNRTLLALATDEATYMHRNLVRYMVEELGFGAEQAYAELTAHITKSEFNVVKVGLTKILRRLDVEPVIFVSPSGHYSLKKAANLLGYGEVAIRTVDVDASFRINVDKLDKALSNLAENEYVAAVVAISGTTEEGAIDPLHKIVELRDKLSAEQNRSFWLHIDGAWGGYMRSLFCGYDIPKELSLKEQAAICRQKINESTPSLSSEQLWLADPEIYESLLSYSYSDSITIDPHKQGYTPYSAGVVSFRNAVVTEHIKQDAHYVFRDTVNIDYNAAPEITNVGSFILEGSKSSAAATACYLAHKSIPLTLQGHGRLVKSTLQSTTTLQQLMEQHIYDFDGYTLKAAGKYKLEGIEPSGRKFAIIPLHTADSNLLCYVIRPVVLSADGKRWSIDKRVALAEANALCDRVYQRMTKNSTEKLSYNSAYEYYASKSEFFDNMYSYESLKSTFEMLGVSEQEYHRHGLFVFRTTVMNPFYQMAKDVSERDYLDEFITGLHSNAEAEIQRVAYVEESR